MYVKVAWVGDISYNRTYAVVAIDWPAWRVNGRATATKPGARRAPSGLIQATQVVFVVVAEGFSPTAPQAPPNDLRIHVAHSRHIILVERGRSGNSFHCMEIIADPGAQSDAVSGRHFPCSSTNLRR